MSDIVQNFLRRIEKIQGGRPTLPPPGTNHVDDNWTPSDIYPGEFSLDLDKGKLYTSDQDSVIILNAEKSIEYGLELIKPTSGTNKLAVSSGLAVIEGRYFFHETTGTDIIVPSLSVTDYTLAFIYGEPTTVAYSGTGATVGSYTLNLDQIAITGSNTGAGSVVQKVLSSTYSEVSIPENAILLGAVLISPSVSGVDLFPATVVYYRNGGTIARLSPADFLRKRAEVNSKYEQNALYFENQQVVDGNTLYVAKKSFVSVDITTDLTAGNLETIAGGGGGGSIEFFDEGVSVGTFAKVNFVGADVYSAQKPGDPSTINVYIPAPTYASHYNTTDGTTNGTVSESGITRQTVRISSPTTEGSPFYTGGWAGSNRATHIGTTPAFTPAGLVTGVGGDSTFTVEVFSADGTTLLATYTTPAITGNAVHTSSSPNAGITVTVTDFATDSLKYKATLAASVNVSTVFTTNSLSGGRYHIKLTHTTDTSTDGGVDYTYTQTDVFYDTNPSTPSFGGSSTVTISESATASNIVTKHLSGVEYYIATSKFNATASEINNLNANTQGRAAGANTNFQITAANYGLNAIAEYAWLPSSGVFTGWTNYYNNTNASYAAWNWAIPSGSFRYRGTAGTASATLYDPWAASSAKTSSSNSILIDTVSGSNTQYVETFNDETYRKESDYTTAWDSTATLSNGEACVVGGTMVRPDRYYLSSGSIVPDLSSYKPDKNGTNPNYTGFSADASFYRLFYTTLSSSSTPIPSFSMVLAGTFVGTALSDLQNEYLKIFVRKIGATVGNYGTTSPVLCLHGAEYNFGTFNDGSTSGGDTPGIRLGSSSGGTINGTFGGFNATNGIYVEIQICNSAIKIDTVTVAFN